MREGPRGSGQGIEVIDSEERCDVCDESPVVGPDGVVDVLLEDGVHC